MNDVFGRDEHLMLAWTELQAQKKDPYSYSQLPYWLCLDVWGVDEGLLVLSGVEPGTVVPDPAKFPDAEWTNALAFNQHRTDRALPTPDDLTVDFFGGNETEYEEYLKNRRLKWMVISRRQDIFLALRHKIEHSIEPLGPPVSGLGKWRPSAFMAWAERVGFVPDWYEWARDRELLPDSLSRNSAPYFDADGEDYPELLAIAVRAWEHARAGGEGTPRQRILSFLTERYQNLSQNSKEAIAHVGNWSQNGGRPPKRR